MNKEKAKKILSALTTIEDRTSTTFSGVEKQVSVMLEQIKESVKLKTVEQVTEEFKKFQKNIQALKKFLDALQDSLSEKEKGLREQLNSKITELNKLIQDSKNFTKEKNSELLREIGDLQDEIKVLYSSRKDDVAYFVSAVNDNENRLSDVLFEIQELRDTKPKDWNEEIKDLRKEFEKSLEGILNRINNISYGGGNMNRNIAIGGNASVLSKYTDLNIKAGSNVTLTYSNNETTKYLDLTIASSGGGSSVAGTVRSINNIATSQTAGDTAGTDYVYIASQGVALTLPTAVSNTNLYTVKNTSNSSVLVATTGGQTIDDDTNAILAVKYTSIDLISDNTNWKIT